MYKFIFLLFALCSNLYAIKSDTVYAQKPLYERAQDTLSVRQMKEDIEFSFKTLKAKHPNLYAYASPKQFKVLEKQMYKQCNRPMSTIDFNYLMMQLNMFTDGHSGISYLFHEEVRHYFPYVSFIDSSMWMGDREILSINKIPTLKLIAALDSMVSWELHSSARSFRQNNYLRIVLATAYQISPPYTISVRQKGSNIVTDSILQSNSPRDWSLQIPTRNRSKYHKTPIDSAFFLQDSIALLSYNTSLLWAFGGSELDNYMTVYFKLAKERGIKYLFIDLSQNGGGSDKTHNYIIKHLKSKEDFYTQYRQETKDVIKEHIKAGWTKRDKKENIYIEANNEGFDGEVFVIMGNNTYSAGFSFCEKIKRRHIGLLVGEESGQRFPFAANMMETKLPHSKIPIRYSTTYIWHEEELPSNNGFLQPDIPYDLSKPLQPEDYKAIIRKAKEYKEMYSETSTSTTSSLSPEEMRGDIDFYIESIRHHSYLKKLYSKEQLNEVKATLYKRCSQSMPREAFKQQLLYLNGLTDQYTPFEVANQPENNPIRTEYYPKDSFAVLRLESDMSRGNNEEKIKQFFDSLKISNTPNLFIDITKDQSNTLDLGNAIGSLLSLHPFEKTVMLHTGDTKSERELYLKYLEGSNSLKQILKTCAWPFVRLWHTSDFNRMKSGSRMDNETIPDISDGYAGRVFIVQSGLSKGNVLSSAFPALKRGYLVGKKDDNSTVYIRFIRQLPHSSILFNLPIVGEVRIESEHNENIYRYIPYDVSNRLGIEDFRNIIKMSMSLPEQENFKMNSLQN